MKKSLIILLALVLAGGAAVYGYNIYRNVSGGRIADESCVTMEETMGPIMDRKLMELLFAKEAAFVEKNMHDNVRDMCGGVRSRLAWWRWNIGASYAVPDDEARMARMKSALETARLRCPGVMRENLLDLDLSAEEMKKIVDGVCGLLEPTIRNLGGGNEPRPAWQWPGVLRSFADSLRKYHAKKKGI